MLTNDGSRTTLRATQKQSLGEFGEEAALRLLEGKGFVVEKMPRNFPLFDLMAKNGSNIFLVTVKTRNKYYQNGRLKKDSYNLYTKSGEFDAVKKIADFIGAEILWISVTVDTMTKTFSAYAGDVEALRSPKRIPMHPEYDLRHYEALAVDTPDDRISAAWSNRLRIPPVREKIK